MYMFGKRHPACSLLGITCKLCNINFFYYKYLDFPSKLHAIFLTDPLLGFLPMTVVCEGTSTQPSIADLLEWLSDLERIHNELYP